jgi:protein arginine kinase activator
MLCDICKKNDAVMHYTEVREGHNTEYNLCRECAELKGLSKSLNIALSSLGGMLAGMIRDIVNEKNEEKTAQCPECGMALVEFKKMGRLGCPGCYQTFSSSLKPLIQRIHGINGHLGKVIQPTLMGKPETVPENTIERLRLELQMAVQNEEYEKAAVLRDRIKELEVSKVK